MSREFLLIGFLAIFLGKMICDYTRISMLKRFALQRNLIEPNTNLWWNNKAALEVEGNLPKGPIRTRVKMLRAVTWVFWLGYGVVLLSSFHHTASMNTR